jgi:hypothetical protein
MQIDLNLTSQALCDMYDIKRALSKKIKSMPKDNEGTEITIGDCIDDVILFLENLYEAGHLLAEITEKERLIDAVIKQAVKDVESQDLTAIAELLEHVPNEHLQGFLSEGEA